MVPVLLVVQVNNCEYEETCHLHHNKNYICYPKLLDLSQSKLFRKLKKKINTISSCKLMTQANYLLLHTSKLFNIIHSEPHIKVNLKNDCFFGSEGMAALKLFFRPSFRNGGAQ